MKEMTSGALPGGLRISLENTTLIMHFNFFNAKKGGKGGHRY